MKGPWELSEEAPPFSRPLPPLPDMLAWGGRGGFSEPENLVRSGKENIGKENIGKEKSGKEKSGKENIRKRDCLFFPHQERPRSGPPRPRGACLLCAGNRKGPAGGAGGFLSR